MRTGAELRLFVEKRPTASLTDGWPVAASRGVSCGEGGRRADEGADEGNPTINESFLVGDTEWESCTTSVGSAGVFRDVEALVALGRRMNVGEVAARGRRSRLMLRGKLRVRLKLER